MALELIDDIDGIFDAEETAHDALMASANALVGLLDDDNIASLQVAGRRFVRRLAAENKLRSLAGCGLAVSEERLLHLIRTEAVDVDDYRVRWLHRVYAAGETEIDRLGVDGLNYCRSPSACLFHCSGVKRHALSVVMRSGLSEWLEDAVNLALFSTFTCRHDVGDSLESLASLVWGSPALDRPVVDAGTGEIYPVKNALSELTSSWYHRNWRATTGYRSHYRATEATFGQNGWHLHHHVLSLHSVLDAAGVDLDAVKKDPALLNAAAEYLGLSAPAEAEPKAGTQFCDNWCRAVNALRAGAAEPGRPRQHSRRVSAAEDDIAGYLSKVSTGVLSDKGDWDVIAEILRGDKKLSRQGGFSVYALFCLGAAGKSEAVALCAEFMRAHYRRHPLRASKGFWNTIKPNPQSALDTIDSVETLQNAVATEGELVASTELYSLDPAEWNLLDDARLVSVKRAETRLRKDFAEGASVEEAITRFQSSMDAALYDPAASHPSASQAGVWSPEDDD